MKSPSPSDFQLWLFFDPVSVIPWIFLLPLTFIVIVNNCESKLTTMRFKAGLALYGQMLEALSLPYVLTGAAIGWVIVVNSPDNPSWIGGLIIGWALPGGLALASGYLITKHTGYYRLAKPLSRWAAYFIIFGLWGSGLAIWGFGAGRGDIRHWFVGYDLLFLLFTPLSFIMAFAINRFSPRPVSLVLADLSILNVIVYTVVALTYWLWGATSTRLDFIGVVTLGGIGIILGCSIYHASYLWSLTEVPVGTIEVRTKNWHFLEIFSLFFFFLFAPESISGMANRKQIDEKINQLLIEVRAHSNKTVIGVGRMSVRQTHKDSGTICSDLTNQGLHVATGLTVEFTYELDSMYLATHCLTKNDSVQIYIPSSTGVIERLEVGETQNTCSTYSTRYRDNDKPFTLLPTCDPRNLLAKVGYRVSYSQDPIARSDYQGFVESSYIEKLDTE